tara:strand:+ start:57 stop:668 length:612 start_codon:yes stop_codon:yes gene_type:complete
MYTRFDDWQILSGIKLKDKICFINITNESLFKNFKSSDNFLEINQIQLINKLIEKKIKLDKIVIADFFTYKKIPNRLRNNLNTLLKADGKIILFKKNKPPYININFYHNKMFPKMSVVSKYSILPFYDDNPLFFLPINKISYTKHSLKIMISIMKTISPETRKKFGPIFTISLFLINLLLIFNLHIIFRVFTFGKMIILKKND